jgi:hypothetical protein
MTGPCSSRQIGAVSLFRWSAPLVNALVWCCLLASGSGCGLDDVGPGSRLVGGRCTVDRDCDQLCISDAPFPGGYCSVRCRRDFDCPSGSACIPEAGSGGLCLAVCGTGADCVNYGTPYTCRRQSTLSGTTGSDGAPGAQVCIGR